MGAIARGPHTNVAGESLMPQGRRMSLERPGARDGRAVALGQQVHRWFGPWHRPFSPVVVQCRLRREGLKRWRHQQRGLRRSSWLASTALLLAPLAPLPLLGATEEQLRFPRVNPPPMVQGRDRRCNRIGERHYAVIVVGDEPAAVMTLLELRRQFDRDPYLRHARLALVTDADVSAGLGGTLVRSGLAYLDRNQVPDDMASQLPVLAPSSDLYERFLRISGVNHIAADRQKVSRAFRQALQAARIEVLPRAQLIGVRLQGHRICTVQSARHGSLGADLFIDASLGARLAQLAQVPRLPGMGDGELADQSLALGWIFELEGLTYGDILRLENRLTQRLLDPGDREARKWLRYWPQYRNHPERLRADLLTVDRAPKLAFSNTSDSIDQRSPALAIAFHGQTQLPGVSLRYSRALLDKANIAVLPGRRLSVNALLFRNDASLNRRVLAEGSRPQPWMRPVAERIEQFFLRHGARRVIWMPELYVRSADQIAHPLAALSAERMAAGGVPRQEALGTFTYALDFRGGLRGMLPVPEPTFNFGYRHTIPREITNLAVLGPASGFGGPGAGAGRIIELNISVGQGLAIASTLALQRRTTLAAVDPVAVAELMPPGYLPYGRPSRASSLQLWFRNLDYRLIRSIPGADQVRWPWFDEP
jgi:hypothetical protein